MRSVEIKIPYPPSVEQLYKTGAGLQPISHEFRVFKDKIIKAFKGKRKLLDRADAYVLELIVFQSHRRRRSIVNSCRSLIDALVEAKFIDSAGQICDIRARFGKPSVKAFAIMKIEVYSVLAMKKIEDSPEFWGEKTRVYTWYETKLIRSPQPLDCEDSQECEDTESTTD